MWPDEVTSLLPRTTFPGAGSPLSCAVSGGADSLALLALAVAAKCQVTAIHVDHGIRPHGHLEAEAVAQVAQSLGAQFRSVRLALSAGPNLEARARAARFDALPADVATGHTMDDQAETVLGNLLRGAAVDGLAGMRPGPRHPLLALRRHETRQVCRSLAIEWFEDPTNADPRFLRNRVRAELLPLCNQLSGRDVVPVLARQAEVLGHERQGLEDWSAAVVPDPADVRQLATAPLAAARRALRRWLRDSGVGAPSGGRQGLAGRHPPTLAEVQRVLEVAQGKVVATELSGGWRVRRSGGRLELRAAPGCAGRPLAPGTPPPGDAAPQ